MKVYAITETLLAEYQENITELYAGKEKAFEVAESYQEKYENEGFHYAVKVMEVKQ